MKDDSSKFLHVAESEDVVITRHGKPADYRVGFEDDDWIDYHMLRDPKFQERMRRSFQNVREGKLISFEALKANGKRTVQYRPGRHNASMHRVAETGAPSSLTVHLDVNIASVFKTPESVMGMLWALIETMPKGQ